MHYLQNPWHMLRSCTWCCFVAFAWRTHKNHANILSPGTQSSNYRARSHPITGHAVIRLSGMRSSDHRAYSHPITGHAVIRPPGILVQSQSCMLKNSIGIGQISQNSNHAYVTHLNVATSTRCTACMATIAATCGRPRTAPSTKPVTSTSIRLICVANVRQGPPKDSKTPFQRHRHHQKHLCQDIVTIENTFAQTSSPSKTPLQRHRHYRKYLFKHIVTMKNTFAQTSSISKTPLKRHRHYRKHLFKDFVTITSFRLSEGLHYRILKKASHTWQSLPQNSVVHITIAF